MKSDFWFRPVRLGVRTADFQSASRSSILLRATKWAISSAGRASALQAGGRRFEPYIAHHLIVYPG